MTEPAALPTELVPIGDLSEYPKNYNRGDDEEMAELLKLYGQWRPAVVQRSSGHVLVGNTMLRAARDLLGWTKLNVHWRDVDDDTAKRILLADNHSRDLSTSDDRALLALLAEVGGDTGDFSGTTYRADDFDDLRALLEEAGGSDASVLAFAGEAGSAYGEGGSAEGRNVRQTPSYSEYQEAYSTRATRFIALIFPLAQFAWVVERMGEVIDAEGVDSNSDALIRLLEARTGTTAPAADATLSDEQVAAAEAAAEAKTEEPAPS